MLEAGHVVHEGGYLVVVPMCGSCADEDAPEHRRRVAERCWLGCGALTEHRQRPFLAGNVDAPVSIGVYRADRPFLTIVSLSQKGAELANEGVDGFRRGRRRQKHAVRATEDGGAASEAVGCSWRTETPGTRVGER